MILSLKYFAILLASFQLRAQTLTGDTLRLRGVSLPATCEVGQLKFNSSNSQFYGCTASNTWGTIGGSGADRGLTNLTATSITVSLVPSGGTLNLGSAGSNYWNQVVANSLRDTDGGLSYDIGAREISNGNITIFNAASNAQIKVFGDGTAAGSMVLNKPDNTAGMTLLANSGMTASFTLTFPANVGTPGQVLTSDNGTLSFTTLTTPSTIATVYTNKIVDLGGASTIDFTSGNTIIDSNGDVNINANVSGIVNYGSNRFRIFSVSGTTAPIVEFREVGASNYVGLKSPNSISADVIFNLPGADGTAGQVLKTDGSQNWSFGDVSTASTSGTAAYAATSGTASNVSGIVAITNGGTNNATLSTTAGGVLYMDGTKVMNAGAGTTNQFLLSQGASPPQWTSIPRIVGARLSYSAGTPITSFMVGGSWINGIGDNGTGDMTLTIAASYFSSAPACTCTVENGATGNPRTCKVFSASATGVRIITAISGGADADEIRHVVCVGPY